MLFPDRITLAGTELYSSVKLEGPRLMEVRREAGLGF